MNGHKLLALLAFFIVALGAISLFINVPVSHADDGIPANCESADTDESRALFPRYEFNNQRVQMVSWTTGADAITLDANLVTDEVIFRDWTRDCRFLLGAVIHNGVSDTVVWDAVNGGRVATVNGARRTPHAYHLYADRLIVETINGGVLVNLGTGSQVLMPAAWDEITNRNFRTRPSFNSAQGWIEVRLADGEATAYNSTTGAQIENYLELYTQIYQPERLNTCSSSYYAISDTLPDHRSGYYVRYEAHQVILYNSGEVVRVLNGNLQTEEFLYRKFSDDCRYYVAHVQRPGERIYDTYVWDVNTSRQIIFEDARFVPHNFSFIAENRALIHTRNGGYLWNLVTDERVLLTEGVSLSSCYSGCTVINFTNTQIVNNQLWMTTLTQPNGVTVYDLNSGAQLAFYDSGSVRDARFGQLNDRWMLISTVNDYRSLAPTQFGLWNTQTGEHYYLVSNGRQRNFEVISEDDRYFVQATEWGYEVGVLQIWDLHNLNADRSPNLVVDVPYLQGYIRYNYNSGRPLLTADGIMTINERVYNIFTGETLYFEDTFENIPAINPIDEGDDSPGLQYCDAANRAIEVENGERRLIDRETEEVIATFGTRTSTSYRYRFGYLAGGRYLTETYDAYNTRRILQLWDACTFEPADPPFSTTVISNHNTSERLIIWDASTYPQPMAIWNVATGEVIALQLDTNYIGIDHTYWDYGRGRLMIFDQLIIRIFDMRTGVMITYLEGQGSFENASHPRYRSTRIVNNQWAVLSGPIFSVFYNLDTFENFALRTDESPGPMAISPSGRYVVVNGTVLRVWDVTDQPVDLGDRRANFLFGGPPDNQAVAFIDETTIEVTNVRSGETTRWNIRTGEQISTD